MYIESTDIKEIVTIIQQHTAATTAVLFVAENSTIAIDELVSTLQKTDIQFIGGIYPKIIHHDQVYDHGIVVVWIADVLETFAVQNLNHDQIEIPSVQLPANKSFCTFTVVDGLTANISNYLSELYRNFGTNTTFLGGGAGSLSLEQQPCVFDNQGFYMDAAVVVIFETSISIGVQHGWKKIAGPYIATKTSNNVIEQINWQNALEVYKETIMQDSGADIRIDNFFSIAKGYPFGIVKENAECVVRDPIATNPKGELICVGEVPENTVLDILKGENSQLIDAAKDAANIAINAIEHPSQAIIIDCISRALFLEDQFTEELQKANGIIQLKNNATHISGALTLGEISSYNGFLEFFNKTIVIGLFK